MLGVKTIKFFSQRIYMKIEFSSQRREMLLFLTTNIAAVTSRANQQYDLFDVINNQNEYGTYAIIFLKFPGLLDNNPN